MNVLEKYTLKINAIYSIVLQQRQGLCRNLKDFLNFSIKLFSTQA